MFPAQVIGSRAGDDANLRRRVAAWARVAAAAGVAVLATGFLVATAGTEPAASFAVGGRPVPTPTATAASAPADLSPAGTAASPVIWQPRRTSGRTQAAVLTGYHDYVGTVVRLTEEPDPADPALPEVALEPELGRLRRALSVSSDGQVSRRGRVVVMASVLSVRGNQATVLGCQNFAGQRWYDGAVRRTTWRGGAVAAAARLALRSGRWRVYQVSPAPLGRCHR